MLKQLAKQPTVLRPVDSKLTTCVHGRMIDDVLMNNGTRSGQVRCLECGIVFVDPYGGLR